MPIVKQQIDFRRYITFDVTIKSMVSLILLSFFVLLAIMGSTSFALSPKDTYLSAESYYKALRNNTAKQKYRDNWFFCIAKYQEVYKLDPKGPWAAAGMYMSGKLYLELYHQSKKELYKNRSVDIFQRVKNKYPKSRYSKLAKKELQKKSHSTIKLKKRKVEKKIRGKIKSASKKQATKKVKSTPKVQTSSNDANSYKKKPVKKQPVIYSEPAIKKQKNISGQSSKTLKTTGNSDKNRSNADIIITNLRYWTNPSYTRIVIDADKKAKYNSHLLKRDPSLKKPQRLYIDFHNCRLQNGSKQSIPINDNLLRNVRAAQYSKDSVRVVIDIKSFNDYKIFSLNNPFRVVVDIRGKTSKTTHTLKTYSKNKTSDKITSSQKSKKTPPVKTSAGALAKQLSLGVSRIVIDAGHGGKDVGAIGHIKGIYEKNVALDIAKRLAVKLRRNLKCEVILTRNSDKFLTLEERTAFANTRNADLFISIHTNAARNKNAYGIETYFLNLATDKTSISVAARENATSTKNISDLQSILNDLMRNAKINESSRLAGYVQDSMYNGMKKRYDRIKNKGVKQAPFYVLLGAQMPAILIETSFISNPKECKRLTSTRYKDLLCDSIAKGVKEYIQDTNMGL
ncbi:MAG: hypothetical protein B6I31_02720 [Desulfobacteraceae bacterium 4572_19]|nr:MAG: hypothetical protein B6I31_02720 [Desulfobacteraceae bacterium 4572_19]